MNTDIVSIDGKNQVATFKTSEGEIISKEFKFLHIVPRFKPSKMIAESGLSDLKGYLDVDLYSLLHKLHSNIWGIGDCTNLPTSKTAAAVLEQTEILKKNILICMTGKDVSLAKYDGYTACPIFVGGNKLLLAEFKYNGQLASSFGPLINALKPNWFFYIFKRYFFPNVYWNLMPRGLWRGRSTFKF